MAPFLVILLLLALGAGIVAWHTIGYPHWSTPLLPARPRRKPTRPAGRPEPPAEPAVAEASEPAPLIQPVARPEPTRPHDPFAHAPLPDMENRP